MNKVGVGGGPEPPLDLPRFPMSFRPNRNVSEFACMAVEAGPTPGRIMSHFFWSVTSRVTVSRGGVALLAFGKSQALPPFSVLDLTIILPTSTRTIHGPRPVPLDRPPTTAQDVLCGKGMTISCHAGNKNFRYVYCTYYRVSSSCDARRVFASAPADRISRRSSHLNSIRSLVALRSILQGPRQCVQGPVLFRKVRKLW